MLLHVLAPVSEDVPMIDQTFGFDTAATEAAKAVNTASAGNEVVLHMSRSLVPVCSTGNY